MVYLGLLALPEREMAHPAPKSQAVTSVEGLPRPGPGQAWRAFEPWKPHEA